MRVLAIGASGFIGQHVIRRLKETSGHEVIGTFRSRAPGDDGNAWHRVELTDPARLEQVFQLAQPEVVIHLAAIADVRTAQCEPARATAVNVAATSAIARLSNRYGARLIFISTEYVFSGKRGYYREDETPQPTTHYGQTKWEAEQEVAKLAHRWSIVRTSIVYGWPEPGQRNFAPWLVARLRNGRIYHGSTEVYRTPIYVGHLTDGIVRLVEEYCPGIHHVAGADWVSMYDFAVAVAETFQLDRGLIIPVKAASGTNQRAVVPPGSDRLGLDCAGPCACWVWRRRDCVKGLRRCERTPDDPAPAGCPLLSPRHVCRNNFARAYG